jgi:hypothetical protein
MGLKVCTLFCVFVCAAPLVIDKYLENGNRLFVLWVRAVLGQGHSFGEQSFLKSCFSNALQTDEFDQ